MWEPGATIIPLILSSDKTQITTFGGKSAYPIYLTIGNLLKEIRCKPSQGSQILLGYLTRTKFEHITNQASRCCVIANIFHKSVQEILEPIKQVGRDRIAMTSGDRVIQQTHPLYMAYCGDYPERVLVNSVKYEECPMCDVPCGHLGDFDSGPQSFTHRTTIQLVQESNRAKIFPSMPT